MVYFDCANASMGARGAECQKTCHTLDMDCISIQCASGCICPDGLVLNNNGSCVPEEQCPCMHNGEMFQSGETIQQDCNTCICKNRKWNCTNKACHRSCVVYGEGHYKTFDGKWFDFSGDCEYTLTQDYCASNPGNGSFRVITENIPCGSTGATCSKSIKVFLGNFELQLSDGGFDIIERDIGSEVPYQIRRMGIYFVIEAKNGLILMWDKKTSVLIKLSPEFEGNVCGLCGNYDGSVYNEFTTRSQSVVVNVQEFGNSWKDSPTCPDAQPLRHPCLANPYRQSWAQKHCSIIISSVFAKCQSKVDPTPFYEACVHDSCACDSGGDCECFCTAVAAYAAACNEAGICIAWRTPEMCPLFCDYYNPDGECEWHYKPCGAPCMKTCRNPSGNCKNQLPGLEGCYPKCPKDRPFFDEDVMKCVAQANCGCYDDDGKRYSVGDMVPSFRNCESCICTKKGRRCQMDLRACSCYYGNMKYNYGDVIYNTTDGIGGCIIATCSANGTINRSVYPCVPSTVAPTTFVFDTTTSSAVNLSTTEPVSVTSVSCLEEICKWSTWYDVTCPKYGENEGDFETFEKIRENGHSVCKVPSDVECRAQKFPKIPVRDLGQIIQCNKSMGLVCHNQDQFSQLCFNYEIRILCCSYVPCGQSSISTTPSISTYSKPITKTSSSHVKTTHTETLSSKYTLSTTGSHSYKTSATGSKTTSQKTTGTSTTKSSTKPNTTPCKKQKCTWTPWYDVHFPSIASSDGDFETFENIRAAGNSICQKPDNIECRAERFPTKNIAEIGQMVTCNVTYGLICKNEDQDWNFPLCYNYQLRVLCCSLEDCSSSTTHDKMTTRSSEKTSKYEKTTIFSTRNIITSRHVTDMGSKTTTPHKEIISTSMPIKRTSNTQASSKSTTGFHKSTTEFSHEEKSTTQKPVSVKTTRVPSTSVEVTSTRSTPVKKTTTGEPYIKSTTQFPKSTTKSSKSTTKSSHEAETTSQKPISLKTTRVSTASGKVTSTKATTVVRKSTTGEASSKSTTGFHKSTTEFSHEEKSTPQKPISAKTTKVPTLSVEVTSTMLTKTVKQTTTDESHPKSSTKSSKSTTKSSQEEKSTSQKPISTKTTRVSTASGEVTSPKTTTVIRKSTTGEASSKSTTGSHKSTTESSHEEETTSQKPTSLKTTKMSTASVKVTSAYTSHTNPLTTEVIVSQTSKVLTSGVTSSKADCEPICEWSQWFDVSFPNEETNGDIETYENIKNSGFSICEEPSDIQCRPAAFPEIPIEDLQQNVQCNVSSGLTCYSEEQNGPFAFCFNYEIRIFCCSKCASPDFTGSTPLFTTETVSVTPFSLTVSTSSEEMESSETTTKLAVTKSTTNSASPQPTEFTRTTEESSYEAETASQIPFSIKTTESADVTSRKLTTPTKFSPTKLITSKVSTVSTEGLQKTTTESEEEATSVKLISVKTTEAATLPLELMSTKETTPNKLTTTLTKSSHKPTTEYVHNEETTPKRTTKSSHEEDTTSQNPTSLKTTRVSTASSKVTSNKATTPVQRRTTGAASSKSTTGFHKPTTESSHEDETTSKKPTTLKTTRVSTASAEVTSNKATTPLKKSTTRAASSKSTTGFYKSTTGSSHEEEATSQKPTSLKTTRVSTASGEVTSTKSTTPLKKSTTGEASSKSTTGFHKSTTESSHEEKTTSQKPTSLKTTRVSTASGEITSNKETTPLKKSTTRAASSKSTTGFYKSTTESSHEEETTSQKPTSLKTTRVSTAAGEVTTTKATTPLKKSTLGEASSKSTTASNTATTPFKKSTTGAVSSKSTTGFHKSTTESSQEEKSTSQKPTSVKTTRVSTASGEVTSTKATTPLKKSTSGDVSSKSTTDFHKPTTKSSHEEEVTSQMHTSLKTTRVSTESVKTSTRGTSVKKSTAGEASSKSTTNFHYSTSGASHVEETTSQRLISHKVSTASGEVTFTKSTTPIKKSTTEQTLPKSTAHFSTTEPISVKTTKMSTLSGEVASSKTTTGIKESTTKDDHPKFTTHSDKSTTTFSHEEATSEKPSSLKTTKVSSTSTKVYTTSSKDTASYSTRSSTIKQSSTGYLMSTITSTSREISSGLSTKTTKSTPSTSEKVSTSSGPRTITVEKTFFTTKCICNVNGVLIPADGIKGSNLVQSGVQDLSKSSNKCLNQRFNVPLPITHNNLGQIIYNTTDNGGWCFYARCNDSCQVERYSKECFSSTAPTITSSTKTAKTATASTVTATSKMTSSTTMNVKSTKTSYTQTSTPASSTRSYECGALMPPRMINETWMIDNCTMATCTGGNNIAIMKTQCPPVQEVVCANRMAPKKTYDESGCCYQKQCECVCGAWGTSHYITFDGTYYDFDGQCTYVLVQQITPRFDHFRVYIDNFSCIPEDPTCVKSLRIIYNNNNILLTSQEVNDRPVGKVYFNDQRVYPALTRNGIQITNSGIYLIVQIPELGAYISFNVLSFTIKLPLNKFSDNTEGHCGKCSNNRIDDCILPNGQLAPSCTQMAGQWGVPSQDSSSCSAPSTIAPATTRPTIPSSTRASSYFTTLLSTLPQTFSSRIPSTEFSRLPSTYTSTSLLSSTFTSTSILPSTFTSTVRPTDEKPCNPSELCRIILSSVFESCHNVVPPEPFYQSCVSDGCNNPEGTLLCSSMQMYAMFCSLEGVCVDWRNSTNGTCSKNCSSDMVYKACASPVESTCNSKYNQVFVENQKESYVEGCFCPEGTTKFSSTSNQCVSSCGCTGPDGMPREPGDIWDSNCQTCVCDNATMTVMCAVKACMSPTPAVCSEEGSMSVTVPDPENPCCQTTECRCNISLCTIDHETCKPGYELVTEIVDGKCCPVQSCVPKKVCVYNNTEYQPGSIISEPTKCETCTCSMEMDQTSPGPHNVSCTPILCALHCAEGYEYQNVPGKCCGKCVQTHCIMQLPDNSTYLLQPGEIMPLPGDNCTNYECVKIKDNLMPVASKISCPKIRIDECQSGTIQKDASGCCQTCIHEPKKCQIKQTKDIILENGCTSVSPVAMSYCQGSCDSYSMYSQQTQTMQKTCTCCQERETENVTITLKCPTGELRQYSYINIKSCGCQKTHCKESYHSEEDNSEEVKSSSESREHGGEENNGNKKKSPVTGKPDKRGSKESGSEENDTDKNKKYVTGKSDKRESKESGSAENNKDKNKIQVTRKPDNSNSRENSSESQSNENTKEKNAKGLLVEVDIKPTKVSIPVSIPLVNKVPQTTQQKVKSTQMSNPVTTPTRMKTKTVPQITEKNTKTSKMSNPQTMPIEMKTKTVPRTTEKNTKTSKMSNPETTPIEMKTKTVKLGNDSTTKTKDTNQNENKTPKP
ncbi:hypothetical protein XELAEV_18022066mg [Xenopus laevis]|uniref:Mucin-5AC n=1 Tax=Xenopus laevis TaxID=8355 RepID=A0A974HMU5_XENLA|nr:hypothetical protein XELAEV_18022066mg [Xenopus laevis]